jgi:tRNA-Thr(GGU) m(6)t(6)A37 methyltransferase TsaA
MKEQQSKTIDFTLVPIGVVESSLKNVKDAPCQGNQGAPEAWINVNRDVVEGIKDIRTGAKIIVLTWFHLSKRETLKVHPQDNINNPLTSVFATRSADRPNPIGLHEVTVLEIANNKIKVIPLEAINGTPVIDLKPVL